MGKWLGPVFGSWTSKGNSGQDLAPFVRAELGKLVEFMGFGQLKTHATTRELADGTVIQMFGNLNGPEPILAVRVLTPSLEEPEQVLVLYMETGVNDPISVGAENPLRLLPANWQIMDGAPFSGKYQGYYDELETTYLANNESLAVGEGQNPSSASGLAVYLKKLMMGLFPASVFTGRLRFMMQAHYGANNELTTQFRLDVTGFGEVLLYAGGIQIGFWSHLSAGIVRVGLDNDLDFRLVTIAQDGPIGNYIVKEYRIILPVGSGAAQAKEDYRTVVGGAAGQEKTLSYLLAHSTVGQTATLVGTFATTSVGTDTTGGWHFNNAGTKAACALTQRYIDGSGKYHWKSTKVVVDFGYSTDQDGIHHVTLGSVNEDTLIQWHDVPNVQWWVPNPDFTTTRRKYANWLYEPTHRPTEYAYTDAIIHCYYDADDVLQPTTADHTVETYANVQTFDWSANITPSTSPPTLYDHVAEGWVARNEARWFSELNSTNGTTDQVAIGSTTYDMVSSFGTLTLGTVPATGAALRQGTLSTSLLYPNCTWTPDPGVTTPHEADWESESRNPVQCGYNYGEQYRYAYGGYYWVYESVDVYFPIGDAEAVHVATMDYWQPDSGLNGTEFYNSDAVISHRAEGNAAFGATPYGPVDPWFCTEDANTRWGPAGTSSSVTPEPIGNEISVFLHSRDLDGEEGDYTASVNTYFFRDKLSEDPAGPKFSESWKAYTRKGDFVGALGHTDTNIGTWTGWF